jgi:NAD(P)H-flavin reductase
MSKTYHYKQISCNCLNQTTERSIFQVFLEPIQKKLPYQAGQYVQIQYPQP